MSYTIDQGHDQPVYHPPFDQPIQAPPKPRFARETPFDNRTVARLCVSAYFRAAHLQACLQKETKALGGADPTPAFLRLLALVGRAWARLDYYLHTAKFLDTL